MRIDPKHIKELQEILKKEYGKEMSEKEAAAIGQRLVSLYQLIYRPLPWEPGYRESPDAPAPKDS
jgi:hypothetical protein